MKKMYFVLVLFMTTIGCAPIEPVIVTDVEGEYVIVGRDITPIVSSQKEAEKVATRGAIDFCTKLNKNFRKRYVVTSPVAPAKWADATLYFRCIDNNSENSISEESTKKNIAEDLLYTKLTNLKKLYDNGTITEAEFNQQKLKILEQK